MPDLVLHFRVRLEWRERWVLSGILLGICRCTISTKGVGACSVLVRTCAPKIPPRVRCGVVLSTLCHRRGQKTKPACLRRLTQSQADLNKSDLLANRAVVTTTLRVKNRETMNSFISLGVPPAHLPAFEQEPRPAWQDERRNGDRSGYAAVNGPDLHHETQRCLNPLCLLLVLHGRGDTLKTSFGHILPELACNRQVKAFEQQGY